MFKVCAIQVVQRRGEPIACRNKRRESEKEIDNAALGEMVVGTGEGDLGKALQSVTATHIPEKG